jgi:hypothetical protein
VRVTKQWAKIMEKDDSLLDDDIMRWNRFLFCRNNSQADDFRK